MYPTEVYTLSNQLCEKTLADHGETYEQPPALSSGICHADDAPAASSSTNSTGTAQATGSSNSTSSSSAPKATSSDFEGAASNFGVSIAALAVGGIAFMAI